jgi:hypothetical protein
VNPAKIIKQAATLIAVAIIGIIVFKQFFDNSEESQKKNKTAELEEMVSNIEKAATENRQKGTPFTTPLIIRPSAKHTLVSNEKLIDGEFEYLAICATSKASDKIQRAQTMVNIALEIEKIYPNMNQYIWLAPHEKLCSESRLIGIAYYVPSGKGWKNTKEWSWNILTTNHNVTESQIEATLLYEGNKKNYKEEFGVLSYSEKLNDFVEKKLGHKAEYVTSGMWIDNYFRN